MLKKLSLYLTASIVLVSAPAFSQTNIGNRDIELIACDPVATNLCRITISGTQVGASACRSRQISLDMDTSAGRASYAMALTAQISGLAVGLTMNSDDASCVTSDAGTFPTATDIRLAPAPAAI